MEHTKTQGAPTGLLGQALYAADGFWREVGDQRLNSQVPLMSGGPLPLCLIIGVYLHFVRRLGPQLMKSRDPYDLRWIIRPYNLAMSAINGIGFWRVAMLSNFGLNYFGCRGSNTFDREIKLWGYVYFFTKLAELLDTVFFILRKKHNQASKLHVFHHSFMVIVPWAFLKLAPGGSSVLFPLVNAGVHTIMYAYYFLATFPQLHRFLWWKKYLTELQMAQFVLSTVHFAFQMLLGCAGDQPRALAVIGFTFNIVFLLLFANFYYHTYSRARRSPEEARRPEKKLQ